VLSRRLGGLQGRGIGTSVARVLLVSVVAAVGAWFVGDAIGWAEPAAAIVAVVLGILVATGITAAGLWVLHVDEFRELLDLFRLRRGRKVTPGQDADTEGVTP
jgi:membrane protein YdbS with pleckstrin-like domain